MYALQYWQIRAVHGLQRGGDVFGIFGVIGRLGPWLQREEQAGDSESQTTL